MKIVTVAIPLYNAEKYIARCLQSVLSQTYQHYEILVIDDCSTDNSPQIVEQIASQCSNPIRLVRQEVNKGVGEARNRAIDEAQGDYLYFIDSDDIIEPNALQLLVDKAEENSAQISMGSYYVYHEGDSSRHWAKHEDYVAKSNNDFYRFVYTVTASSLLIHYVWNMLIDVSFLRRSGVRFPLHRKGEDQLFFLQLMPHIESACVLSTPTYHYIQRADSLTKSGQHAAIDAKDVELQVTRLKEKCDVIETWQSNEYFGDVVYAYMREAMWMAMSLMRNKRSIVPAFPHRQIGVLCHYPSSFWQAMSFKRKRLAHVGFSLLSAMPTFMQEFILNVVLKIK